jgi:hypothetical protein
MRAFSRDWRAKRGRSHSAVVTDDARAKKTLPICAIARHGDSARPFMKDLSNLPNYCAPHNR